jgi:hypothetical protein
LVSKEDLSIHRLKLDVLMLTRNIRRLLCLLIAFGDKRLFIYKEKGDLGLLFKGRIRSDPIRMDLVGLVRWLAIIIKYVLTFLYNVILPSVALKHRVRLAYCFGD